jgi:hypothetical protein
MSERIFVGTRKGLFEFERGTAGWDIADTAFLGDPVTAVYADDELVLAGLDLGHFGAKVWRKVGNGDWTEVEAPAFPEKPEGLEDDPHPWTLGRVWNFTRAGDGAIWAGTMPGGLFKSEDNGATWALMESFWTMPERRQWFGVAGGEQPGLSTVLVDPADPKHLTVGISCAGVWESKDAGATWDLVGQGFHNEYMPPDQQSDPMPQDIHQLAHCRAVPNIVWCQHHSGIYRSEDGGHNWYPIKTAVPSDFGFAVVAHPKDPNTAWFVPANKDERRYAVDAKVVISRTRDGGKTFEILDKGLPSRNAYDLVYRHAFACDDEGRTLAFGSTTGGFWVSDDGGETWAAPDVRLPPIAAVRFAAG